MKKILVTAIGGDIGQSIASCIIKNDKFKVFGTETHQNHAGTLFAEKVDIIPKAESQNYLDILEDKILKNNIDVVIPVNEQELKVITNTSNKLNIISANKEIIDIGLDKLKTMIKLSKIGIKTPWTIDADSEEPLDYPCIFKPRFGSGSKSIFVINSDIEARFFSKKFPKYVFQKLIYPFDRELTCCVYRKKDGNINSIQFERELVGGMTGWAKVIYNKKVEFILHKIAEELKLNGSINIQLRLADGEPMIFEINPRFSSTALMRHNLGFKDVLWSINEFFDIPFEFSKIKTGAELVRTSNINIISKF
tara:strand:+ start:916 stop:1839 length:924 start_codon:yes stop_codon:yes gene_type:complete